MSKKNHNTKHGTGYASPPEEHRFKHGKSGNPAGRPKKKPKTEAASLNPARFPTRRLQRQEAARHIQIREADKINQISVAQAVLRSLAREAIKGGPMAMRIFLQMAKEEDEKYHAEEQRLYDYWSDVKERQAAILKSAEADGVELPDLVPHPDDIQLDWKELTVTLHGPMNEEQKKEQDIRLKQRDLIYELSLYYNEKPRLLDENGQNATIGQFFLTYLQIEFSLPKRMRCNLVKLGNDILLRMSSGRSDWEDYLEQKCKEFALPFFTINHDTPSPFSFPLDKLGFEYADGEFWPNTPETKRALLKMLDAMEAVE